VPDAVRLNVEMFAAISERPRWFILRTIVFARRRIWLRIRD
jgi:hypothetical protein